MRRIYIYAIILNILIPSFPASAVSVPDRVRIGLKYSSSAMDAVTVNSADGFIFRTDKEIGQTDVKSILAEPPAQSGVDSYIVVEKSGFSSYYEVSAYCENNGAKCVPYYSGNGYHAVRENIFSLEEAQGALNEAKEYSPEAYIMEGDSNRIRMKDAAKGNVLLLFSGGEGGNPALASKSGNTLNMGADNNYRDILEFKRNGFKIDVISNVTMQNYLLSVVPAEIGASAPIEAQKAQAVCARTYAVQNLNKHSGDGFDLCAGTHCQMYIGTKWERESSNKSVWDTNGQIILYDGKPITAVYSAHSGGRTADVKDVWGSSYAYLKSVEDPYCNDYVWESNIDFDAITKTMAENGYSVGRVSSLRVLQYSDCGRALQLEIVGDQGSKIFERERARTILGLKSQMYSITESGLFYNVLNSGGVFYANLLNLEKITFSGRIAVKSTEFLKTGQGNVTEITSTEGGRIVGKGNGHGVGFCQCGAMGFANAGWDYIAILKHYYQGVEILLP